MSLVETTFYMETKQGWEEGEGIRGEKTWNHHLTQRRNMSKVELTQLVLSLTLPSLLNLRIRLGGEI